MNKCEITDRINIKPECIECNLLPAGTYQKLHQKSGVFSVIKLVDVNYWSQNLHTCFH